MTEEGVVETIDCAADGVGPPNQSSTPKTRVLVEVAFQKNPYQKNKYLEAEPKALGITQIMLSLFIISTRLATLSKELLPHFFIGSLTLFGLIAGGVAIGSQNLHLPTLKACLGVQVVLCIMSVICFMNSVGLLLTHDVNSVCWMHFQNGTSQSIWCYGAQAMFDHIMALEMLMLAAQIALSATLAAFCCKVVQCCSPRTSVPVMAVNTAQAPQ